MKKSISFILNSPNFGGHENMFLNILDLIKDDYQIKVFVNQRNKILINRLKVYSNIDIVNVNSRMNGSFHFNPINILLDIFSHYVQLKKNSVKNSLLIFFDGGLLSSLSFQLLNLGSINNRILCIPLLPDTKLYNSPIKKLILTKYLKTFAYIVTVNKNYVETYKNIFSLKNVLYISNFVIGYNYDNPKLIKKKNRAIVKLLYFGRIQFHQKQLDLFISNIAVKINANFHFTIIGDGPDRDKLIQLVHDADLSKNFEFVNWTNVGDIEFNNFDLMFQCSNYEGDSLSVLDSISNGLNVISTDTGTFNEYFPSGQIFDINSHHSFIKAVEAAIENSSDKMFWENLFNKQKRVRNVELIKLSWSKILK